MTERLDELRKAAKLVAEGKSDQEVAVALGLSAAQIKRWRQNNPRFQRNLALRLVDPAGAANMDMLAEVGEELGKREDENPESESSAPDNDIPPVTDAGASLTMPQRAAIELLVGGLSVTEVADRVGVNRSTIARWKRDDAFAQEHDIRMQQSVTELRARMPGMLNKAIDVLQAQLDDGDPGIALQFLRLAFRYGASSPATANYPRTSSGYLP
jgi:transcriptional regulator with XRE-family HTH domain